MGKLSQLDETLHDLGPGSEEYECNADRSKPDPPLLHAASMHSLLRFWGEHMQGWTSADRIMSGALRAHVDVSLLWERQPEQVAHVAQQHVKADIFTTYVKGGRLAACPLSGSYLLVLWLEDSLSASLGGKLPREGVGTEVCAGSVDPVTPARKMQGRETRRSTDPETTRKRP